MKDQLLRADEPTRRRFIARTASSLLGVGLLPNFQSAFAAGTAPLTGAKAKNVIYLYMDGGMSHVDTWDPKQGEVAGPTKTIKTSADGVLLGEYLPRTAKQMHHGTIVRSLTSSQGAHEQGNYFMHTSYQLRGTINHPSMGAWLSHFRDRAILPCRGRCTWATRAAIPARGSSHRNWPRCSSTIPKTG